MLVEKGLVTKVEEGFAWVNTRSKLACSSCQVESSCGNSLLEKYLAGKIFISKIENRLGAQVGDQVRISIEQSSVSRAALLVYGLPLFFLLLGAIIAELLSLAEPIVILVSLLSLVLGVVIARFASRRLESHRRYVPQMVSLESGKKAISIPPITVKNIK